MDTYEITDRYNKNLYSKKDLLLIKTLYMIYLRNLKEDNKKTYLPIEIIDLILFRYICKLKIKIDDKCIIRRKINGIIKEQIVKIDNIYINNNKFIFEYHYGIFGYHEGFCKIEEIREMTDEEKELSIQNKNWSLPQQFYQSFPSY